MIDIITRFAKELVNKHYQPMGVLHCKVSNDVMYNHAKQCAVIGLLHELETLTILNEHLGEHTSFIQIKMWELESLIKKVESL